MLCYALLLSNRRMALYIINYCVNCCVCKCNTGISTAVVNCNSAGVCVTKCSAGEGNVLNVAYALINLARIDEVLSTSVLNLPRLVLVENTSREAVYKAVAALKNTVVEAEPALVCLDRDRTCAYLLGLPCSEGSHNVSVLAPVLHIGRLRDVHITERCMAAVGRSGEHQILVIYLSREKNTVSVEGQECVLALIEGLEIKCIANADGRLPAVSVAPCYPISVFDPANSRVIAVAPLVYFLGRLVSLLEKYSCRVDVPVNTVIGEASVQSHISLLVVNSENACKLALEGNYSTVEDRV